MHLTNHTAGHSTKRAWQAAKRTTQIPHSTEMDIRVRTHYGNGNGHIAAHSVVQKYPSALSHATCRTPTSARHRARDSHHHERMHTHIHTHTHTHTHTNTHTHTHTRTHTHTHAHKQIHTHTHTRTYTHAHTHTHTPTHTHTHTHTHTSTQQHMRNSAGLRHTREHTAPGADTWQRPRPAPTHGNDRARRVHTHR